MTAIDNEVAVGYDTRWDSWGAAVRHDAAASSLSAHYGIALNKRFASGASFAVRAHQQELLFNNVWTFGRRTRLRISADRLFEGGFHADVPGSAAHTTDSRLIEIRRIQSHGTWIADIGLSFYHASSVLHAAESGVYAQADDDELSMPPISAATLRGYAVNLSLAPSDNSQLRFDFGAHRRNAFSSGLNVQSRTANAYQIQYAVDLKACSRLEASLNADRFQQASRIQLESGAWSAELSLARTSESTGTDFSLVLGYAIAIGKTLDPTKPCPVSEGIPDLSVPLLDHAVNRPLALPNASAIDMDGS